MGWKATGQPTVRRQRDKWVVRVDGIDTETGRHRPRQLGTYQSQRAAVVATRAALLEGQVSDRGTLGWLLKRYVASRTDVSVKAREQYEWAASHIEAALGAIPLDRLDREDIARWIEEIAAAGKLSRRSIQICLTSCALRSPTPSMRPCCAVVRLRGSRCLVRSRSRSANERSMRGAPGKWTSSSPRPPSIPGPQCSG